MSPISASLLNSSEFRKYLPSDFSQSKGLIEGTGSGGFPSAIDSYLRNNRYYTQNAGNSSMHTSSSASPARPGRCTRLGQAVYDTASSASTSSKAAPRRSGLEGCQGRPRSLGPLPGRVEPVAERRLAHAGPRHDRASPRRHGLAARPRTATQTDRRDEGSRPMIRQCSPCPRAAASPAARTGRPEQSLGFPPHSRLHREPGLFLSFWRTTAALEKTCGGLPQ